MESGGENKSQPFDYSPESLIPLWDWYETKIKQVPKSKKEMEYEVSRYPKWMEENIQKITMKYTDETLSLALDISIYLGETIIKNYPNLYWGQIGKACSTKNSNLYGFIDFGLRCVFVSADSSSQVTDFMENIHVRFQWYKLDGKLIEKTHGTQKPIRKRALLDIEPAIETLNHFINVIDPQSLEQEIAEVGQRLGAVIPEPLKKFYLCIPRKYLDAPNCFVLPG